MGVCSAQEGAVHDEDQFAVWKQRQQDVQYILLRESSVMEGSGDGLRSGIQRCRAAKVDGNLAVPRGFGLNDAKDHGGDSAQQVNPVVRKSLFQEGDEGVKIS